jgi:hypothetical protein
MGDACALAVQAMQVLELEDASLQSQAPGLDDATAHGDECQANPLLIFA